MNAGSNLGWRHTFGSYYRITEGGPFYRLLGVCMSELRGGEAGGGPRAEPWSSSTHRGWRDDDSGGRLGVGSQYSGRDLARKDPKGQTKTLFQE